MLKDHIKEHQDKVVELKSPLDNVQSIQRLADLPLGMGTSRNKINIQGESQQSSTNSLYLHKQLPHDGSEKYDNALNKFKQMVEIQKEQMEEQRLQLVKRRNDYKAKLDEMEKRVVQYKSDIMFLKRINNEQS